MQNNISLVEAKKLYNAGFKDIAMRLYSEKELLSESLPKSWEELGKINGFYVDNASFITGVNDMSTSDDNTNIAPDIEYCDAWVALCQLLQLRKRYIGDWKPDWSDNEEKWCISIKENEICKQIYFTLHHVLSFPNCELIDEFIGNFGDLLQMAKPLL